MWIPRPLYEAAAVRLTWSAASRLLGAGVVRRARVRAACCSLLGGAGLTLGLVLWMRRRDYRASQREYDTALDDSTPLRRRALSSVVDAFVLFVGSSSAAPSTGRWPSPGRLSPVRVGELVQAELDHVAVGEPVPAHALAAHEDAVGAVQVLDPAAVDAS
ncbi:MAG: hypothetical protein MZV65_38110 [Chromatiales bacterium]|nr:hypothetical protein [Chromatiales bacterium]